MSTNFMERAVVLSANALGRVWPNPAVGCVLVSNTKIIGEGATASGGRPHAENIALQAAGDGAKGATAYVTLEPCAHEGATPSCARLLAEAGVQTVYIAISDPDPRTNGKGVAFLEEAGIKVFVGLLAEQATSVLEGYLKKQATKKPFVTLKLASSRDGMIARSDGSSGPQTDSDWITSIEARNDSQLLRANHDAILVGVETANCDDPLLTCRIKGFEHRSPIRIILDSHGRIKPKLKLIEMANEIPTWIVCLEENVSKIQFPHVRILGVSNVHAIDEVLIKLADAGITKLLVEGGAMVARSFIESGNVDRFQWYKSKESIGRGGLPVIQKLDEAMLMKKYGLAKVAAVAIGPDMLETYERNE